MLQFISNFLYEILVRSRLLIYMLPVVNFVLTKLTHMERRSNHKLTDAKGQTINVCKVNGKIYPPFGEHRLSTIKGIRMRSSDVLLCGYPKTGCHWTHEMLHMLVNGKAELTKFGKGLGGMIDVIPDVLIDSLASPRILNTHLPYEDLPKQVREKKVKIVLTVRNPKDTAVSYYNHNKKLVDVYNYHGEFQDHFELFVNGQLEYGDYFDYYSNWGKVMKTQKDNPILFLSYEELKADTLGCVKRMAKFLDIDITDEFAQEVVDGTSFNTMKSVRDKNDHGTLFRKGTVGDWRSWLTDAQSEQIDKIWREKMVDSSYQPIY